MGMQFLVLVLSLTLQRAVSIKFEDVGVAKVTFSASPTGGTVRVDENNNGGTIDFVKLTEVQGSLTYSLQDTTVPDFLKVTVKKETEGSYILSGNLVDYEKIYLEYNVDSFIYRISDESGTDTKFLTIYINNLIDENPTLTTEPCIMDERKYYDVNNSPCKFRVSDPDGYLEKLDLSGIEDTGNNESHLFALRYKEPLPVYSDRERDVYLVLQDGQQLDYIQRTIYSFHIAVKDSEGHPSIPLANVPVIVQVNNIPCRLPVWEYFPHFVNIKEKTESTTHVSARDGDFGINAEINYRLTLPANISEGLITIDEKTGVINIGRIDRDAGFDQVVSEVTAYEAKNLTSKITERLTLLVEDIDDHIAEISVENSNVKSVNLSIDEHSSTIPVTIWANDIDAGQNALYTTVLTSTNSMYMTAIEVVPDRGFGKAAFSFIVKNTSKLDYEDPDWRIIKMEMKTIGIVDESHIDTVPITIYLKDINDELPTFDKDEYFAKVREDVKAGYVITSIQATDKDEEDIRLGLNHTILGTPFLTIESKGGNVSTKEDRAFDYERQPQVFVTIQAKDHADHTAITQLTIDIINVDDEDPRIVVKTSFVVDENQKNGAIIASGNDITAFSPDSLADLEFSINWELSSANQNSKTIKAEEFDKYKGCIVVETVPKNTTARYHQEVSATLRIKETVKDNTPDYEVFDTLLIFLVVTDKNYGKVDGAVDEIPTGETQENGNGTASAQIIIKINNTNDHPPEFANNTQTTYRRVEENSQNGTVVGVVAATDKDMDPLTFYIESADPDTQWIGIDNEGTLFVRYLTVNDNIDCDDPVRWNLTYTVTVSDGLHNASTEIKIYIDDQNDNPPQVNSFTVHIFEDNELTPDITQDGAVIFKIPYVDKDRDEAFHTVRCTNARNDEKVIDRFIIDKNVNITVSLTYPATLNREDISEFSLQAECQDNPNSVATTTGVVHNLAVPSPVFTITLMDLNDKIPELVTANVKAFTEHSALSEKVTLEGKDEDAGENGTINFVLAKVQRFKDSKYTQEETRNGTADLFLLTTDDQKKSATLKVNKDLKDFYGYYRLTIKTTDNGTPPQSKDNTLNVEVTRYNFEDILITFPNENQTIFLQTKQNVQSTLKLYNGGDLKDLSASDQQHDKYKIEFSLVSDLSVKQEDTFYIDNNALKIKNAAFTNQLHTLTFQAQLDANNIPLRTERSYTKNVTAKIQFLDRDNTDPVFDVPTFTVSFKENTTGQEEQLPKATYPDFPELKDLKIYYLLGDTRIFSVDSTNGILSVKELLDYTNETSYDLLIHSSNVQSIKPNAVEETKLRVTVLVIDINDHPPFFEEKVYYGTFVVGSANKVVATVKANDVDTTSEGKLSYSIREVNSSANGQPQNGVFTINSDTGVVSVQFELSNKDQEYFTVSIVVEDEPPERHWDTTTLYVFIVTKSNLVEFKFQNPADTVRSDLDEIKLILDESFGYKSNTENPSEASDKDPVETTLPVYFIDPESNKPVEAADILRRLTNVTTFKILKAKFADVKLFLMSFDPATSNNNDTEKNMKVALITVSVVLATLLLMLSMGYLHKIRSLKRTITKLSTNKFGSQDSGLNRQETIAPTTNKHALHGSNPVYDNVDDKTEVDRASVTSGASDLAPVENDYTFNHNTPLDDFKE